MYLKSALQGNALNIIQAIPVTTLNYNSAWISIMDRYENVQILSTNHLKMICRDTPIKRRSPDELRKLISDLNQNTRVLKELSLPVEYWDVTIIHLASRRLDQDLRDKWRRLSHNNTSKRDIWLTFNL